MLKLYYLRIADFENYTDETLSQYVSRETQKQISTIRSGKVRRTKLLGEAMTRCLLTVVFGLGNDDYRLVKGEHGKPYVKYSGDAVFFNLSHSRDYIICGLSEREVGVDIERKGKAKLEVAHRFFHPTEIQKLEMLPEPQQTDCFFRYWSAKESFLKYTGSGLSTPLSAFEVCFEQNGIFIRTKENPHIVYMRECLIDEGYKCFICSSSGEMPEIHPFLTDDLMCL